MLNHNMDTIRTRIILATLVLIVLVVITLTAFTASFRMDDQKINLQENAIDTVQYTAELALVGVISENKNQLIQLAQAALKSPNIKYVFFKNSLGDKIASVGKSDRYIGNVENCPKPILWNMTEYWLACAPVSLTELAVDDYSTVRTEKSHRMNRSNDVVGYVYLVVSLDHYRHKRIQMIRSSVLMGSVCLMISLLIAFRVSKSISNPVVKLSNAIEEVTRGNLNVSFTSGGPQEIRKLSMGINSLLESVASSRSDLELRIESATKELSDSYNKLQETSQDLEKALRSKDEFIGKMSHELRTPITSIIGFSRLLERTQLTKGQTAYISNITTSSSLLLSVINDLLHYAKYQSGTIELECIRYNLREKMEDMIGLISREAFRRNLELVLMIDSDVPEIVEGDPMRLLQVLNNLLNNSVKFTEKGTIVVQVSTEEIEHNLRLLISVKDSGIGMSEEQMNRIFVPFQQADASISRLYGGTGLGLVIAQQLVTLMGGRLSVTSNLNVGSIFVVDLPLVAEAPASSNIEMMPLSVLAYDQNPWSRRSIRSQLSRLTNKIMIVESYERIFTVLANKLNKIDVLILGVEKKQFSNGNLNSALGKIRTVFGGKIILLGSVDDIHVYLGEKSNKKYWPLEGLSKPIITHEIKSALLKDQVDSNISVHSKNSVDFQKVHALYGLNLLLAEDNVINRMLIREILEYHGAKVYAAGDGNECYEQAISLSVLDAILMDVHMPNCNGVQAVVFLKNDIRTSSIPIVGLTANVGNEENYELLEAGAVEVLGKPIDEEFLVKRLCYWTNRQYPETNKTHGILSSSPGIARNINLELERLFIQLENCLVGLNSKVDQKIFHEILGIAGIFGQVGLTKKILELKYLVESGDIDSQKNVIYEIRELIRVMDNK